MQIDWIMALCHRLQVHICKAVPHGIDPLSMSIAITDLAADVDVRDALFVSLPDFRRRVLPGEGVDQINALFPPARYITFTAASWSPVIAEASRQKSYSKVPYSITSLPMICPSVGNRSKADCM